MIINATHCRSVYFQPISGNGLLVVRVGGFELKAMPQITIPPFHAGLLGFQTTEPQATK